MSTTPSSDKLAHYLWQRLTLIYLFLAICLTTVQGYNIYASEKDRIESDMRGIAISTSPALSLALWKLDKQLVESILSGLVQQGSIVGAQVLDENINQFVRIGEFPSEQKSAMTSSAYKAAATADGKEGDMSETGAWIINWSALRYAADKTSAKDIGYLQLISSNSAIWMRAKSALATLLLTAIVQAIAFIACAHILLQKIVHIPLKELISSLPAAQHMQRQPVAENKLLLDRQDEIGELYRRINDYQQATNNELQQIEIIHDTNTRDLRHSAESRAVFLGNLSHGIRGQMNGVMGMAELLRETPLSSMQNTYLTALSQSGEALLETLGNMLDLAQIESGTIFLEQADFHVHTLIRDCVAMREPYAASKHLPLRIQLDLPENTWLKGDPLRLKHIRGNLVDNAIRSTERGSVSIHVHAQNHPTPGLQNIRIVVTDTGCGLSTDLKQHIFDLLKRDNAEQQNQTGTFGLGLSICRELVRLMNGNIGVESKEGEGATFWFMLPMQTSQASEMHTSTTNDLTDQPHALYSATGSSLRVLVVEDNLVNQMVIVGHLKKLGITPEVAADGQQAVKMCTENLTPFNVIFMDSELPVMDGRTATREILAHYTKTNSQNKVLICGLSAHVFPDELAAARAAGMKEYLTKPVRREVLQALLEQYLSQHPV